MTISCYYTAIEELTDKTEPDDYYTTISELTDIQESDEIDHQENGNRQRGESKIMNIGYFCFSFYLRHSKGFKCCIFFHQVLLLKI